MLAATKELNLGQPRTNPVSSRVEGLNLGPPDYKSSALTTRPHCLLVNTLNILGVGGGGGRVQGCI